MKEKTVKKNHQKGTGEAGQSIDRKVQLKRRLHNDQHLQVRVSNIHTTITEEERNLIYQKVLNIFLLSGGRTEDEETNGKAKQSEGCSICKAEP